MREKENWIGRKEKWVRVMEVWGWVCKLVGEGSQRESELVECLELGRLRRWSEMGVVEA